MRSISARKSEGPAAFAGATGTLALRARTPSIGFPNGLGVFSGSYEGTISVP